MTEKKNENRRETMLHVSPLLVFRPIYCQCSQYPPSVWQERSCPGSHTDGSSKVACRQGVRAIWAYESSPPGQLQLQFEIGVLHEEALLTRRPGDIRTRNIVFSALEGTPIDQ